jgi:beta-aspartyl-peptidase (threonine type)
VTEAALLEECPLFNAGIGSVFTRDETHELDACVMDGTLQAGAVAGVKHLRNPVLAARLVMERARMCCWWGGAEKFAFLTGWSAVRRSLLHARALRAAAGRPRGGQTVLDHGAAPLDETKKWAPSVRWRWMVESGGGNSTAA